MQVTLNGIGRQNAVGAGYVRSAAVAHAHPAAAARPAHQAHRRWASLPLWIVQVLLAALFLFAGLMKLVMSEEAMAAAGPVIFPMAFLRFIGACETLGALGLVLPGLARVRPGLTSLAAAGLVIIMIGATVTTAATIDVAPALFPLVVGLLAAAVAYGRWRLAPHRSRRAHAAPVA
jgi:uncharacterized membrane protein YphA (DoxX/SURF4 family)